MSEMVLSYQPPSTSALLSAVLQIRAAVPVGPWPRECTIAWAIMEGAPIGLSSMCTDLYRRIILEFGDQRNIISRSISGIPEAIPSVIAVVRPECPVGDLDLSNSDAPLA